MADLEHKKQLFNKYRYSIPEEDLIKKLGLKEWEKRYILGIGEYAKYSEEVEEWKTKNSTNS